jgi:hypothetical protein
MSGNSEVTFTVGLRDKLSGSFIAEFELSAQQFMRMLSGTVQTIKGEIASPDSAERWGCVPVRETFDVPRRITDKYWGDKAKTMAEIWWEEQPGSAKYDDFIIRLDPDTRSYKVMTTNYVPKDEYDAEQALIEESEEPDMDDDGLDDLDDE